MVNQFGNIIGTLLIVAIVSIALSQKSTTSSVLKSFWDGLSNAIGAAGKAGR